MDEIIVEVYVPAVSNRFDFKMPTQGIVYNMVNEMVNALEFEEKNVKFDRQTMLLCDMDKGIILNMDKCLAELEIKDGAHLMLV